ncbi:hypothetical protein C8A00DRAFT_30728 [Chaetomidium leptoderma]|uniref:HAUS augmin-like complex subunit 1 n=1 Tax=Chaetomidium leptoderma TaxID=669021 RepID=A0AAN7A146_9PEZI|nr:hypothetical protein C8A00DRAFT_30728 [Chaetomidium leptoderma]
MAHLPPNAAIFSPSVARAAASAAKDWSYVDTWLQRKFPSRGPPPFERNADTLRVLLALASANEAADEERALVARLEAETLQQLRAHEEDDDGDTNALQSAREAILTSLETSLTRDGQTALTAMAALALQTHTPLPNPPALGAELISLSTQTATLEQTTARIQTLTTYLAREASATAKLATDLRPPSPHHHPPQEEDDTQSRSSSSKNNSNPEKTGSYHPPPNLALQNLETQRRIKLLSARLPDQRDKVTTLAKSLSSSSSSSPPPSISQIRQEEETYLSLLATKQALDAQVQAFQGLPPDTERARQELEGLRAELRRMTARRDEVFEGLVERETPRKGGGAGAAARRLG